jgi:hypothetical protein
VFREEDYQELRLNNVISDLLQRLYDFLAYLQYESDGLLQRRHLIAELLDREIPAHVERNARRYRQLRDQRPARSYEHYLEEHQFCELLDRYSLTKGRRGYDENLQHKSDALDRHYLINKLRMACDMASRNIVVSAAYECRFLEDHLRHCETGGQLLRELPPLRIYYITYRMLTNEAAEPYYRELRGLLEEHLALFPSRELNILYRYVLNYCVRQINTGRSHYYREILDVYRLLLDRELIFENGYLTQWSYINIIAAGIRLGEYDWTEAFIHRYRERLHPAERDNVFIYNLAAFYFEKQDYQRALQQLHDVEFTDTSYHLGAKIIQLKSYYELDEEEAFFSLLEAFKKYVLRNREIADYRKQANNHFLRLAQQLYHLKINRELLPPGAYRQKYRTFGRRLQQLSPLANKDWLEEAYAKLEQASPA